MKKITKKEYAAKLAEIERELYACERCNKVSKHVVKRVRIDQEYKCLKMLGSIEEWHGFNTYRTCPKCGSHEELLKQEPDEPYKEKRRRRMPKGIEIVWH